MCSIRKTWQGVSRWALGAGVCAAVVGCSTPNVVKTPGYVAQEPQADEATELRIRQWEANPNGRPLQSAALVHNGGTQAWPTRWYYAPNSDNVTVEDFVLDPTMMIVQTVTLPAALMEDYPFRKVYYESDVIPMTYTAMPPLPPVRPLAPPNPDPDPLVAVGASVTPPTTPMPEPRAPLILPAPTPASAPAPAATIPAESAVATEPAVSTPPASAPATQPSAQ